MSTHTLPRHRLDEVQPGDRIIAIDGKPIGRILEVDTRLAHLRYGSDVQGIRLVNPFGGGEVEAVEWFLYPDTQVGESVTVERGPIGAERATAVEVERLREIAPEPPPVRIPADVMPEPEPEPAPVVAAAALTLAVERLRNAAYGARSGQSQGQTLERVAKVLPLLDGLPKVQARLKAVAEQRWRSLGDRGDDLDTLSAEVAEIARAARAAENERNHDGESGRRAVLGTISVAQVAVGDRIYLSRDYLGRLTPERMSDLRSRRRRDAALVATVTGKRRRNGWDIITDIGVVDGLLGQVMLALVGWEQA